MQFLSGKLRAPAALLGAALSIAALAQAKNASLTQVNEDLQAGNADHALALLSTLPDGGANSAQARFLECRVRYALRQWTAAARACGQAVRLDGQNSDYHMWYGRALGEEAHNASFLSAFSLGKQVHVQFETAVQLDPHNAAALSDLGSFDVDAPGIVGGGLDKAGQVAEQLDKVDRARASQLRSAIAEEQKDYGTAERELKAAIAASNHPAFQWTVLASFYRRRARWPEMEWAIHNCVSAAAQDKSAGVALYDGAGILIESNRDPELAVKMLEDYLASTSKTDEAPAFVAYSRLGRLQQKLGNAAEAQRDQATAYALAREYRPPQAARH